MPNKIKSAKQFRFLEAAANSGLKKSIGPSKETAKKMLSHEDEDRKKRFAKMKRS